MERGFTRTMERRGISLDDPGVLTVNIPGCEKMELQMSFCFSNRSLSNLEGVHPDLLEVVKLAGEYADEQGLDFIITDGCRTIEEQRAFVATGKSRTMHSRHLGGFAIDYVARVAGRVSYDEADMRAISECFLRAGAKLRVPVEWGGNWKSFQDTPHIQLNSERYPDVE